MRTDCSINGCQEMDAGVPFCHYYSIHQHALVLEVIQNIRLDGGEAIILKTQFLVCNATLSPSDSDYTRGLSKCEYWLHSLHIWKG